MTDAGPAPTAGAWARRLLVECGAAEVPAASPDSSPLTDWASSGAVALTGSADGPPLLPPGLAATAARGALLALDALAGRPVLAVPGQRLLGERAALAGLRRSAPWSAGGACRAVRTADGWVAFSLARASDDDLLPALVEGCAVGDRWRVVSDWAADRPAQEVADRAQLLGLVAAAVPGSPPAPVWPPWRVTGTGRGRAALPAQPLVVDLSALWAGPLCAHLLGAAGARVVRVESTSRPDGNRVGSAAFDALLHAGQPSVALPLATAEGRARLGDLLDRADVVVTSGRPRALAQLGLDPGVHLAARTDGVWVSVTAHPADADGGVRVGFGDDAAMSAGLVRHVDDVPVPCGDALADPLTGLHAAVAALAGLRAGGRHHVRIALSQVVAATMLPQPVLDAERHGSGWSLGGVPVAEPVARRAAGPARPLGADTDAWAPGRG